MILRCILLWLLFWEANSLFAQSQMIPGYKLNCELQLFQDELMIKKSKSQILEVPEMILEEGVLKLPDFNENGTYSIHLSVDAYSGLIQVSTLFTLMTLMRENVSLSHVFLPPGLQFSVLNNPFTLALNYTDHQVTGYHINLECHPQLI